MSRKLVGLAVSHLSYQTSFVSTVLAVIEKWINKEQIEYIILVNECFKNYSGEKKAFKIQVMLVYNDISSQVT